MRLHRFIGDFNIEKGRIIDIPEEISDQIRSVLRLNIGDVISVSDGRGSEGRAEIVSSDRTGTQVRIVDVVREDEVLERRVVLFASIIKKENFELVVQKAVECGVAKIVPVISERTVKLGLNMERIEKIAREAAEQSGRTTLAEISAPTDLHDALDMTEGRTFFFHPGGNDLSSVLNGEEGTVSVFIGPEGGFSEGEIMMARERGAEIVGLGKFILRAETAAIIATYIVRHA